MIFVDPSRDLVAVVRWLDIPKLDGFIQRLVKCPVQTQQWFRYRGGEINHPLRAEK